MTPINSRREDRPNLFYSIKAPDGTDVYPMLDNSTYCAQNFENFGCWRHGASTMHQNIADGRIEFIKKDNGAWVPYEKIFAPINGELTKKYTTWIDESNNGAKVVKDLFGSTIFDYPKTPDLLLRFIKMANVDNSDIVLDFFSGSATTAHAVMQLNAEDGGNRKFIMVQLPEVCDAKSEAAKAGYATICEIGKERIRRAGAKIEEELKTTNKGLFVEDTKTLDTGFRVFKLDSTNMKEVYYAAGQLSQKDLWDTVSNIKDDRSDIDLLYGCLLDWGVYEGLQLPHTTETINEYRVHTVDDKRTDMIDLIACFDEKISEATIRTIATRHPLRAVFRDSSFIDSADKINVFEIFKAISPDTTVKVI